MTKKKLQNGRGRSQFHFPVSDDALDATEGLTISFLASMNGRARARNLKKSVSIFFITYLTAIF